MKNKVIETMLHLLLKLSEALLHAFVCNCKVAEFSEDNLSAFHVVFKQVFYLWYECLFTDVVHLDVFIFNDINIILIN